MESAGRFRNCEREWESRKQFAGAKREIFDFFNISHLDLSQKKTHSLYLFASLLHSAASVAALLIAGSALTTVSAAPKPGSDEDIQSREADYAHFAEM